MTTLLLKSELKNWSTGLNLYLEPEKFIDINTQHHAMVTTPTTSKTNER